MDFLLRIWNLVLPPGENALLQIRAGLIVIVCLAFALIALLLVMTWLLSGDLQKKTVWAAAGFMVFLLTAGLLAYLTYWQLASWLLIIVLIVISAADTYAFTVASPLSILYVIPVLIAAFNLGLLTSILIASLAVAFIWLSALAELTEWYNPQIPKARSHRTFNAPVLTVMLLTVALMSGLWSQSVVTLLF